MATRKTSEGEREEFQPRVNIPAQEEEADIIEEVGAEEDEESGELVADEDRVRKIGAADPATVREDRRLRSIANKKRQGKKNVGFGTIDPLVVYETILKTWEPDSIDITFKRLSGSQQTTQVIRSRPRSRTELFDVFMGLHGQSEAAEYEVRFHDSSGHQWRGQGRITMPDTRPKGQQGGNGYYPSQNGAPPPQTGQQPPSQGPDPMAMFRQMFELVQSVQPQQPQQQLHYGPLGQQAMPAPPTNPDPASMMKWFQEMFAIVRQAQPTPATAPVAHSPQQNPAMQGPPRARPGYEWIWEDGQFFQRQVSNAAHPERREPMYRGQREPIGQRPYYPNQGEQRDRYDPRQQHQAPSDPLRESMSAVRRAMALREELDSVFGGGRRSDGYDLDVAPEQDPDSPVIIERTADMELVRNREDRSIRGWDTFLVNLPSMIKQGGEYLDKISKTAVAERQRRERAHIQQQLPPGYAYVEVPAEEMRQAQAPQPREDLPPPPAHVPPPIQEEEPEPEPQRGWDEEL